MINSQQLMMLVALIEIRMPGLLTIIFGELIKMATFDLFENITDLDGFYEYLYIERSDPVDSRHETFGLDSVYFLPNLSSLLFFYVLIILLVLAHATLMLINKKNKFKCLQEAQNKVSKIIYWQ